MSVDRYGITVRPELQAIPPEYLEVRGIKLFLMAAWMFSSRIKMHITVFQHTSLSFLR